MKRVECTKCRQLQDQCKCDKKTIDFVSETRPWKMAENGSYPKLPLDTTDKVS